MHKELFQGPRLFLLSLISSLAAVSAVIFTPALPAMANFFGLSDRILLWTMTVYFLGFAGGGLYHTVLANRFGRRSALLSGLSFSLISTLLIVLVDVSDRFNLFCLFRLMQGIGASCGFILVLHMIADTESGKIGSMGSLLLYVFVISIAIAMSLGGFLTVRWDWDGPFMFLIFYNALLFICSFALPETLLSHREHSITHTLHGYKLQFKDSFLLIHACLAGLAMSLVYLYAGLGSFTIVDQLGFSPIEYGLYSLIAYLGMGVGLYSWVRYGKRQSPRISILGGIFYVLLGSIAMQIFFANDLINVWTFFLSSAVVLAGPAIIYLSCVFVAIGEASDRRSAFVVFQFLALLITALVFLVASQIPFQQILFPRVAALEALVALFIWFFLKAHHERVKKRSVSTKVVRHRPRPKRKVVRRRRVEKVEPPTLSLEGNAETEEGEGEGLVP